MRLAILDLAFILLWAGVSAFAFLKGERSEKIAGACYFFSWIVVLAFQGTPFLLFFAIGADSAMFALLATLALREKRPWAVWASSFVAIELVVLVFKAMNPQAQHVSLTYSVAVTSVCSLACLLVGTLTAWRARSAAIGSDAPLL